MKVSELIEELKQFNEEYEVRIPSEHGMRSSYIDTIEVEDMMSDDGERIIKVVAIR